MMKLERKKWRNIILLGVFFTTLSNIYAASAPPDTPSSARFVFIRHGEKPEEGLGQLNCKGLNRALALPDVLFERFGRPDALYAPSPAYAKPDKGGHIYNYIRPLATIEPTAIRFGLPVHTDHGFDQVELLKASLLKEVHYPDMHHFRQVWISWEHREIVNTERALFKTLGVNPDLVEAWDGKEFDRIDIIDVVSTGNGKPPHVSYRKQTQGLNMMSEVCPKVKH